MSLACQSHSRSSSSPCPHTVADVQADSHGFYRKQLKKPTVQKMPQYNGSTDNSSCPDLKSINCKSCNIWTKNKTCIINITHVVYLHHQPHHNKLFCSSPAIELHLCKRKKKPEARVPWKTPKRTQSGVVSDV